MLKTKVLLLQTQGNISTILTTYILMYEGETNVTLYIPFLVNLISGYSL